MTQATIPTQLSIPTQALLDMHWQIYEAMVKDQNAGGSSTYFVAQVAVLKIILEQQGIIGESSTSPFGTCDVPRHAYSTAPAELIFDTQQLLDRHWATVEVMENQEKEQCGSGGYALAQAICLGEILKLGGLKFDRPANIPKSVAIV